MLIIQAPNPHRMIKREKVRAIIIHGTGQTNTNQILDWYTNRHGRNDQGLSGHYTILTDGTIYQHLPEELQAYHTAIKPAERLLYRANFSYWSQYIWDHITNVGVDCGEEQPRYRTWKKTWLEDRGIDSPLALCTEDRPNWFSVGIELQSPAVKWPTIYTLAQYNALAELVHDIAARHKLTLTRETLLGHQDCSPLRRARDSGLTDPGERFDWNRIWDLLGILDEQDTRPM